MLETEEKKKSFGITLGIFLLLFLVLFFFGLSYLDPATEQGIAKLLKKRKIPTLLPKKIHLKKNLQK